MTYSRKKN